MSPNAPENDQYEYMFTVFTPTYNRAHTLQRVFESLNAQTFRDFEWLIMDDGSSDNTTELVDEWKNTSSIPIRFIWQENQGKHIAYNRGVQEARGKLFVALDSDDACVPDTLAQFKHYWESIPPDIRDQFSGVAVHCMDPQGHMVGTPYPSAIVDTTAIEMLNNGIQGEKWGIHQTSILKKFPYPEIIGEKWCPEGLVWNRIAQHYKMRFVNIVLRIYIPNISGITSSIIVLRVRNPHGSRLYYRECNLLPITLKLRCMHLINYLRFSLHASLSIYQIIAEAPNKLLAVIAMPIAYAMFKRDLSAIAHLSTR